MTFEIRSPSPALQFRNNPGRRARTDGIILHHLAAENASVADVHRWHLNRGWAGFGYHFQVNRDGTIWRGRPVDWVGSHTNPPPGINSSTIGIAVQGDYHNVSRVMPNAQFNALVWLIQHLRGQYGNLSIRGHRDLAATACPGQHFPMDEVRRLEFRGAGAPSMPGTEIPPALLWVTTQSTPLNVRSGPGTSFPIVGTLARGTLVSATRRADGWLYVTDGGTLTGWASEQFLTADDFPFVDVGLGRWYFNSVRMMYENDIMRGTSSTTFNPSGTLTRAMAATIIYRLAGSPPVPSDIVFDDVPAGTWFSDALTWAYEFGIVNGVGDGRFVPDNPVTRQEFALMLYRYAEATGLDVVVSADFVLDFSDVEEVSTWALEAMHWAVERGIVRGNGRGELNPRSEATRAEGAALLERFINLPAS